MIVKIWDGEVVPVENRHHAIHIIKDKLSKWMKNGDRLGWIGSHTVFVINEAGKTTDVMAVII